MELILKVVKIERGPGSSITVTLSNSMGAYIMSGGGAIIEPEGDVVVTGWTGEVPTIGDAFKVTVASWTE
jgi:hypothetical protein